MESLQTYRDAAREAEVPEHLIDWALQFARPRFVLRSTSKGGGALAGRYGGFPSLPLDSSWNGYPDYVASIDYAALPQDGLDIPLPHDGHLLFFANKRDWHRGREPGDGDSVLHIPAGTATTERAPEEEDDLVEEEEPTEEGIPYTDPYPLYGRLEWSMPFIGGNPALADEEAREAFREYELYGHGNTEVGGVELALGGHPTPIQDDPRVRLPNGDKFGVWTMLAWADYDWHGEPYARERPFWMIRHEDLADMKFENAETVIQFYS